MWALWLCTDANRISGRLQLANLLRTGTKFANSFQIDQCAKTLPRSILLTTRWYGTIRILGLTRGTVVPYCSVVVPSFLDGPIQDLAAAVSMTFWKNVEPKKSGADVR